MRTGHTMKMDTSLKLNRRLFIVAGCLYCFAGCRSIKPYEKEYLLHPLMDDARVERLSAPYGKAVKPNERLTIAGATGGSSTSCPTCGGK